MFLQIDGSVYSMNRYYKIQRVVVPLWPLVVQNKPMYQLRWGVNNQVQWSIDNIYIGLYNSYFSAFIKPYMHIYIGKGCPHYCQGAGYCAISGKIYNSV